MPVSVKPVEALIMTPKSALKKILKVVSGQPLPDRTIDGNLTQKKLEQPDGHLYRHYPEASLATKAFYNVGAGDFYHPYWINIDYSLDWYAKQQVAPFLNINLLHEPDLPITTASAELFYTSHTIEHLTDAAVLKMFSEAHRALKPSGILRIVCPDADLLYHTLQFSRLDYWHWRHRVFAKYTDDISQVTLEDFVVKEIATERCRFLAVDEQKILAPDVVKEKFMSLGKTEFLNFLVLESEFSEERPHWHINWWNEEKLRTMLEQVGFSVVMRSGYDQSLAAPFHNTQLFDSRCPRISLYIDAIK
jgi:predicted SAM-dependent methyltransferase